MDEFLRDIHFSILYEYIKYDLQKESLEYTCHKDNIQIETEGTKGQISFHDASIIELMLENKKNGEVEFYLHFQLQTLKHAVGLYKEFLEAAKSIDQQKTLKVLLSCSSGLTTGFFASELNEGVKTLSLDYEFEAVSYSELPNTANNKQYDIILLAPQIAFEQARIQSIFHRIPVEVIPSQIFAKYDTGAAIQFIQETLQSHSKKKEPEVLSLKQSIDYPDQILIIAVLKSRRHTRFVYRIYQNEEILWNGQMIKPDFTVEDFESIIRLALREYPLLKVTGICVPGIISGGHIYHHETDEDVLGYLRRKFPHMRFSIDNDVNASVTGIYAVQDVYDSLSFYYLPRGHFVGGSGNVFKGQLIKGYQNIGGELQYIPMNYSDDLSQLALKQEGILEIVAKNMVSIISLLGPDMLSYYCSSIPNVEDLYEEMKKYIPEKYIPVIKKIENLQEYIIFGEMILCIMRIEG